VCDNSCRKDSVKTKKSLARCAVVCDGVSSRASSGEVGVTAAEGSFKASEQNARVTKATLSHGGDAMAFDAVLLHQCWSELRVRLGSLERQVAQGAALEEANNFCRFVLNSRICDLVDKGPRSNPLQVSGAEIRQRAEKLLVEVREWFSNPRRQAQFKESHLTAIDRKLDLIAGAVKHLLPAGSLEVKPDDLSVPDGLPGVPDGLPGANVVLFPVVGVDNYTEDRAAAARSDAPL